MGRQARGCPGCRGWGPAGGGPVQPSPTGWNGTALPLEGPGHRRLRVPPARRSLPWAKGQGPHTFVPVVLGIQCGADGDGGSGAEHVPGGGGEQGTKLTDTDRTPPPAVGAARQQQEPGAQVGSLSEGAALLEQGDAFFVGCGGGVRTAPHKAQLASKLAHTASRCSPPNQKLWESVGSGSSNWPKRFISGLWTKELLVKIRPAKMTTANGNFDDDGLTPNPLVVYII